MQKNLFMKINMYNHFLNLNAMRKQLKGWKKSKVTLYTIFFLQNMWIPYQKMREEPMITAHLYLDRYRQNRLI